MLNLPAPSSQRLAIRLQPRAERAVKRGHPWVFPDGIRSERREGSTGDLAVLFDENNRFLAIGLYDPHSPIRVRVLQHGQAETIDRAWFAARVREAWDRRAPLLSQDTTGFRIINGENDRLPGLIVDRYDTSLVVKLYTAAWIPYLPDILSGFDPVTTVERVVLRLSRNAQKVDELLHGVHDGQVIDGPPLEGPVLFRENGLVFEADLIHGQKTGFFLDQRDNRARVERLSAGRRVLNVFAYNGGFSLYAARGGAEAVASLDISAPALAAAERNFSLNRHDPAVAAAEHIPLVGDAFTLLEELGARGERYDLVILDPPSFAKAREEIDRAARSYERLTRLGLGLLRPGGVFVAASCSSRIGADEFAALITGAAKRAGRPLNVFEQTGHALDHPISFPEGAYLKCIFASAA